MRGYLPHLVDRTRAASPVLRPRLASRYETAAHGDPAGEAASTAMDAAVAASAEAAVSTRQTNHAVLHPQHTTNPSLPEREPAMPSAGGIHATRSEADDDIAIARGGGTPLPSAADANVAGAGVAHGPPRSERPSTVVPMAGGQTLSIDAPWREPAASEPLGLPHASNAAGLSHAGQAPPWAAAGDRQTSFDSSLASAASPDTAATRSPVAPSPTAALTVSVLDDESRISATAPAPSRSSSLHPAAQVGVATLRSNATTANIVTTPLRTPASDGKAAALRRPPTGNSDSDSDTVARTDNRVSSHGRVDSLPRHAAPPALPAPGRAAAERDALDPGSPPHVPTRGLLAKAALTMPLHGPADANGATTPPPAIAGPTVHVTIGRVELRATAPAAAPMPSRAAAPRPALSLADYLAQRQRGAGR